MSQNIDAHIQNNTQQVYTVHLHVILLEFHCHVNIYVCLYDGNILCVFLQYGQNALHHAAAGGHVIVVDWLCNKYPNMITQTDNVSEHKIQNIIKLLI